MAKRYRPLCWAGIAILDAGVQAKMRRQGEDTEKR